MKLKFPPSVKVCLWSYDTDKMSLSIPDDRYRIVMNVLARGSKEALGWLQSNISEKEIKETITESCESEWNKPALDYWSHIYKVRPTKKNRFEKAYGNPLEYTGR